MAMQTSVEGMFAASQKIALTRTILLAYILPPEVCLYFMGVLVQLKGTRFYRLAFLPAVVWLAWRGMFVDMSGGDVRLAQMNTVLIARMCYISMRATVWAVVREPFRRQNPSNKHSELDSESVYTALWNAWDLMFNNRGIGWNWPRGLIVPEPAFETDSRVAFVFLSAARLALHALGFDVLLQIIRMLSPGAFGSPNGGSLFHHILWSLLEFLRSVFATFFRAWMAYFSMQCSYQFMAIVFIVLFQQRPSQWPPLFDYPWLSTSLSEFWGRRWHQMMRDVVVNLGCQPLNYLFGRLGGVLGAFLVSGIVHDLKLRAIGRGGNSIGTIGFWVMNGVGVVLERIWAKATGRRVGGVWGWTWTFGWLVLWGVWVVDEWAKVGRFQASSVELWLAHVALVRRCLAWS